MRYIVDELPDSKEECMFFKECPFAEEPIYVDGRAYARKGTKCPIAYPRNFFSSCEHFIRLEDALKEIEDEDLFRGE